jgi:capsular exopolysaccharide synthesis family protein
VQFLGLDRTARMIQVTSASAGEGKTTTIANLAIALARARHPVVAVCCDLRRPRLHEFFGLSNRTGLTSMLLGHRTLAEALQPAPGVERLMILPSGPLPPNPSELLATSRVIETLTSLKREGGFLLIDSPPVLPVTDAVVISRWVDGTLLVCSASTTNRKHLARAVELLNQVGGTVVGTVLNGVEEAAGYQYNGYYGNAPDRRANGEVRASRSRRDSAAKGNGRGAPAPRPAKRR